MSLPISLDFGPMVTTPETAIAIYIAIARERNAEVVPEDIVVNDEQDRWVVFQMKGGGQGDWMNMERGGGRLELTIMKSNGAIVSAHYSR
jgi:hypothetical protein